MGSISTGFAGFLLGLGMVSGGTAVAQAPSTPASAASVETFFKRAEFPLYILSPDGKRLATLAPAKGRDNLVVVDLEKRTRSIVTGFDSYDVGQVAWITNDRLFFRVTEGRDVTGRTSYKGSYAINVDGSDIRNLDSLRGTPAGSSLVRVIDRKSGDMIIAANLRRREAVDLYKVNTTTNRLELLTFDSPANTTKFLLDSKNVPRFAWSSDRKNSMDEVLWYRSGPEAKWEPVQTWQEGGSYWEPLVFISGEEKMIVRSNVGRDRMAIFEFDVATRTQQKLLAEHPLIDVGADESDFTNPSNPLLILSDPNNADDVGRVVGIYTNADKPAVNWLDPELKKIQETIDRAFPGRFNRFSPTVALGRKVVISSSALDSPPKTYLFDPASKTVEDLPASRPWLAGLQMPTREYFPYVARDGLNIPAFLTKPVGSENKMLPLIVHIHGGPYVRAYDLFGWSGRQDARFLASRGYAVLEPEPRGSVGFGRKHFQGGWGTWGLAMQDDITDGVKALVAKGIVDPERVCLYGGSYGGYATLQGLVREPDMFKCGLATVAVTDLLLFQETTWGDIPVHYKAMQDWFAQRVGNPDKDRERLVSTSPARNAGRIKAPVLLVMGEADVRVPQVHGLKMRDAMKTANVTHEYHVYVGEGHGWNKDENNFDFYKRAEAFFAKHLKP